MRTKNIITLLFFLLFVVWLGSRLVLSRNPVDPLFLTGLFLGFAICFRGLAFGFIAFLRLFKFLRIDAAPSVLRIKLVLLLDSFYYYLDVQFFQNFLNKKKFLSNIFFKILNVFNNMLKNQERNFFHIYLIVNCLVLITFSYEIFNGSFFWLTLYALSLSLLVRRFLDLSLKICDIKGQYNVRFLMLKYFLKPIEEVHVDFSDFFLINQILKNQLLFQEKELQNKKMLSYLFTAFTEIHHYRKLSIAAAFVRKLCRGYEKLSHKIFLNFFSHTFVFLFLEQFLSIENAPFFLVSLAFSCYLWVFFIVVHFLENRDKPDPEVFQDLEHVCSYHEDMQKVMKEEILETFDFLENSDLILVEKNSTQLSQEFSPEGFEISSLTEEENAILDGILIKIHSFYLTQLAEGNISSGNYHYIPVDGK